MWKWFAALIQNWLDAGKSVDVRATGFVADSWNAACGFRIYDFRDQLDEVAKELGPNVRTRFNPRDHRAELYDDCGLLFRVDVYMKGEDGTSTDALITSRSSLPDAIEELLKKSLVPLQVRFEVCS